jgi:signal transduction histidine kinase
METVSSHDRLRSLVEAGMALTSELSLDALLKRLLEIAAELTGARYAALGVIDPERRRLERFVTHGIDPEVHEAIGELPQGRGILGVLLFEAKPLRLSDLTSDPRSVGFPANHPPMKTFLGVPILLRGSAFGNLYLAEKADGAEFSEEDEEVVTLLAAQAAVAIENVRLYEAATRWSARLESLNEVGNALATETDLEQLLGLIARRLRVLLDARFVTVLLPAGPDELRFAAVAGQGGVELLGQRLRRSASKSGRALAERRSQRVDSVAEDPEVDQEVARKLAVRTGLWVPLIARERAIGVLAAHDSEAAPEGRFTDDDVRLAETYASRAAVAVDLSERVARDSLRRVVAAQELERRRLARELHDETGQSLTSILLGLRALEDSLDRDDARTAVGHLRDLAVATLQDVRRLAVELRPKALDDFGLVPALERLAETWSGQTGIAVDFVARLDDERLSNEIATALYRIVQESLTNIVKHAHARNVSVLLTRKNEAVVAVIEDDGRGFDPTAQSDGFGIQGMRERVELVNGRLQIESEPDAGTTLVVEVPLA